MSEDVSRLSVSPSPHLAELNVARLRYPPDAPEVAPFMTALERVNAIAERMPGFEWRYEDGGESGGAVDAPPNPADPRFIANYSIWSSIEGFEQFVFKTVHAQFMRRRSDWFERLEGPSLVMWFVKPGERPSIDEAMERLALLERSGPSPNAFGWAQLSDAKLWRAEFSQD